jgi:diacylglycerol O-acyltransferase
LRRYTPFALASLFVRIVFSIPQREIVTVTTSVPGPQLPLYGFGRRLLEIIPYVPIATSMRTGICTFTYNGQVAFGITGDYDSTPDVDVLARGIQRSITSLLEAARRRSGERR